MVLSVLLAAPAGGATRKLESAAERIFKGDALTFQRCVQKSEVQQVRFAGVTVGPTRTIAKG